jgi:16S rRNA (guanine527-N7)-methyltransferase
MGASIELLRDLVGQLGARLADEQLDRLARYLALVDEYAATLNLTGFGADPARLAVELIGEALRLYDLAEIAAGVRAVDLGSGNGSPVVVLAVLCPEARFTAVEARKRRAVFLRTVQVKLGLANLAVAEQRVELLAAEQPADFDLVTSRAFAPLNRLLPLARLLLAHGGELRGYLGAEAGSLSPQAQAAGYTISACLKYEIDGNARHIYRLTLANEC